MKVLSSTVLVPCLSVVFAASGNLPPKERVGLWESRRVFFLTPQVMQNDLSRGACPAHDVCCVVFDEAHKALGNHAYCQVGTCTCAVLYILSYI